MARDLDPRSAPETIGSELAIDYRRIEAMDVTASTLQFEHAGYIPLPGMLTTNGLEGLRNETAKLERQAKRRDFVMEAMGSTPRHMTTLGGHEIAKLAPAIEALYHDERLVTGLGNLVGLDVEFADDPVERHVLNILHQSGDTHGLHTDDYPLALVMFIESPSCEQGCGHLEFFNACQAGKSWLRAHSPGDAYLLRADKFPHRVQPIHDGCVRTVLNFAYGATTIPVTPSDTASILYS